MKKDFKYHTYREQTEEAINNLKNEICGGHIHQVTDDAVNADDYFQNAERIYAANPDSLNFPLPAPVYFAVDIAERKGCGCPCPCPPEEVINVTQTVWDTHEGNIMRRLGSVSMGSEGQAEVIWSEWRSIGAADCCLPKKLTGPIEFYIRKDGDDDTGDGLSEATALATWDGFYNKYVIGRDNIDANFYDVTINFGPGLWQYDNAVNLKPYFAHQGKLIINGAGMDETTFSSIGNVFSCSGSINHAFHFKNFSLDDFNNGLSASGCPIAVGNLKFKKARSKTTSRALTTSNNASLSAISGGVQQLYFDNFQGHSAFYISNCSRANLSNFKVILTGTCSWAYFVTASLNSSVNIGTNFSYQGVGTGSRYTAQGLGIIHNTNNNQNILPGSSAGVVTPGSYGAYI